MSAFERSQLYLLLSKATEQSLQKAFRLVDILDEEDVQLRSEKDRSTYLHHVVNCASLVLKQCGSFMPLVPIIYKLAMKNINANGQNTHGNTCLHLACIKPNTDRLCEHFIRIGVDPCILNKKGCRVIHTVRDHQCQLVKGQTSAKSGIWKAVETEDLQLTQRLLRSWCRVNMKRNKTLYNVADETGNIHMNKLLNKYATTNELVNHALACNAGKVHELLKAGGVDLSLRDESRDVPRPLVVAVHELGTMGDEVFEILQSYGQDPDIYQAEVKKRRSAFEESKFYQCVTEGSDEQLVEALELTESLDVTLTSCHPDRIGWNYLHFIVHVYTETSKAEEERLRILIRIIFRLALRNIDVNARNGRGETALILAGQTLDQALMTHLIRIGCDPSLTIDGQAVNEEVYEDKGKLVFDKKYRPADLPGLWVAVQTNDVGKANRWLKSWCRVNTTKGDRRLLEVAKDMKRKEIVKQLEVYEHINEFVCATFACDLKQMMNLLALGKGHHKVNTIDDFFHVGFTWDRHAEFMPRPIIVAAMEICTPEVVNFLLEYGANLSNEYEENFPCGPVSFWAFRDHVDNQNALVVAKHVDVLLQDELGCTLLHKAIGKKQTRYKKDIVKVLLDRGVNIAARDYEGSTARDYIQIYDVENGDELRQMIDDSVFDIVINDLPYKLEDIIIESYDHIDDIRGTKKQKSLLDIAELKEFKEVIALMEQYDQYKNDIALLHESAKKGDLFAITKLSGEKRCGWSKDKAGRTLLHNAVLWGQAEVTAFLVENHPNLINSKDNLLRTPLHYCVCLKDRQQIWPILQEGGADPTLIDVNNLSVYDYVRELETPTPNKDRPRGRRTRNYKPSELIETERNLRYGEKAARYECQRYLLKAIGSESLSAIKKHCEDFTSSLGLNELDSPLLKLCIDEKKEDIAKYLITSCGARADCIIKIEDSTGEKLVSVIEYAKKANLLDLVEYLTNALSNQQNSKEE